MTDNDVPSRYLTERISYPPKVVPPFSTKEQAEAEVVRLRGLDEMGVDGERPKNWVRKFRIKELRKPNGGSDWQVTHQVSHDQYRPATLTDIYDLLHERLNPGGLGD